MNNHLKPQAYHYCGGARENFGQNFIWKSYWIHYGLKSYCNNKHFLVIPSSCVCLILFSRWSWWSFYSVCLPVWFDGYIGSAIRNPAGSPLFPPITDSLTKMWQTLWRAWSSLYWWPCSARRAAWTQLRPYRTLPWWDQSWSSHLCWRSECVKTIEDVQGM